MLDRNTVITSPGRDDPDQRLTVEIQEEGAALTLFFDRERAFAGDAPLLEVRLTPTAGGEFEPWRLLPKLPLHSRYARAALRHDRGDAAGALKALREIDTTRRGLSDDALRIVAELYQSLVAEGERYPVKALALAQHVDKSTASRWIKAARDRGLIGGDA